MIAHLTEFLAQMDAGTLVPQFGLGGFALWILHASQKRMETIVQKGFADQTHALKNLSKAIWLDLAGRADAGSFVREEAKRMLAKEKAKDGEVD